ncbi:molybdate ABC transporter substrate-binding protein [Cytobacillus spongiae]|jgi:molybdate transport system substrate-binding protein|uniref:molybdate ABC transporter substrate-binding protein n=1 Tax=Cytobacillus spongiae TaxID=2901381 RepID=UPI001F160D7D|nr:molybdate ABC transporter substrate-binding protein [Cytobacillus spongiae]UII57916.1 molybdate ABC transporter substrate-binding protein [Cytobacillus spongiae]
MSGCSTTDNEKNEKVQITISAAASLQGSLSEIEEHYEKENHQIDIVYNFGGSGSLQQQIIQGAPVDLFFSAAEDKLDELVQKGVILPNDHKDLLKNELVLIIPRDLHTKLTSLKEIPKYSSLKVAIGTPASVPAGQYAMQALQATNIWDKIEKQIVMTKDVRQVLTYVETGNVEAGFVYGTDAIESKKVTIVDRIDSSLHEPIIYPVGVMKESKHYDEAKAFANYLQTEEAATIFKKSGFLVLE